VTWIGQNCLIIRFPWLRDNTAIFEELYHHQLHSYSINRTGLVAFQICANRSYTFDRYKKKTVDEFQKLKTPEIHDTVFSCYTSSSIIMQNNSRNK
jgi:hypothetical protein